VGHNAKELHLGVNFAILATLCERQSAGANPNTALETSTGREEGGLGSADEN
jgi:hypothetical protein